MECAASNCDHGWVDVDDAVRPCSKCRPVEYRRWLRSVGTAPTTEPLPFAAPEWLNRRKDLQ